MDYANTSGIKSPFSPRVRQSITGRRTAKKTPSKFMQSHAEPTGEVIYKTPSVSFETYGMPLPVMVTEALTFAQGGVSVRMAGCGWCWLVAGRRLLAWPLEPAGAPAPAPARELTLPQTDLAHKADLVVVFYEEGAQMPSCIGVSPEGTARYWSSVGAPGAFADVSCELAGQECELLAEPCARHLLLATTSGTNVLLTPAAADGRATLSWRTLRPPSGWLGGLGRRVSTLFFGSMPAHNDTKLVSVVVVREGALAEGEARAAGCVALLTAGAVLLLWSRALHDHELRDLLPRLSGEAGGVELVALDMARGGTDSLLLLLAAVGSARQHLKYALAHLCVADPAKPRVLSLVPLAGAPGPCGGPARPRDGPAAGPRLLPLGGPGRVLLHTSQLLLHPGAGAAEVVDVSLEADRILCAAVCDQTVLVLSARHGLLRARTAHTAPSQCGSGLGSPGAADVYSGNLSLYEMDPNEVSQSTTDACGKLKAAFLYHVRQDSAAAAALLAELFPPPGPAEPTGPPVPPGSPGPPAPPAPADVDAALDRAVLRVAEEMLDDAPAGDPRWQQGGGAGGGAALGASAALQLAAQLADKQRALALWSEFLCAAGLCARLGLVSAESGGGCERTVDRLCALAESVAAALALRTLHQQPPHDAHVELAVQQAVSDSVSEGAEEPWVVSALSAGSLSAADVCYRRVCRVRRVLLCLPPAAAHVLHTVLREMCAARAAWYSRAGVCVPLDVPRDRLALLQHAAAVLQQALGQPAGGSGAEEGAALLSAAHALADTALHDLPPPGHCPRADTLRAQLIQPVVAAGQTERAAALAEKFGAYELLVELCARENDLPRLYRYCEQYERQGLAEATFARLTADGAAAARLLRTVRAGLRARLRGWLAARPHRLPLAALTALTARDYTPAAGALLQLASGPRRLPAAQTLASLSKLCAVAGGAAGQLAAAERLLQLGEQHAALPRALRTRHALDTPAARRRLPEELIQMYVEGAGAGLTEYDYKKALDLTDFVEDAERRDELRLRIWCACILEDDWSGVGGGDAGAGGEGAALHQLMFFRLVDLVHVMGGDVALLLPPPDDILTAPELAERAGAASFAHLLRYGLQCVQQCAH